MLDIVLRPGRCPDGRGCSRRGFLRVGALTPLGLGLPHWLALERTSAATGAPSRRARSVILVFLGGGLSHHDTFDPKPQAPREVRGKYSPVFSSIGTLISETLPRMARTMERVALVRSGAHTNDHHETATNWVLSGRFGSAFGDYPAIGAVVAHETGFSARLPPYVAVPRNPSFTWELGKSAFLGGRCESFKAGDPNQDGYAVRDLALAHAPESPAVHRRRTLLSALDTLAARIEGNDRLDTYDDFQRRAAEMILSRDVQEAFDISGEHESVRERYGRTTFGQSCLLARRLVERGVRFVTVTNGGWDHHAQIWKGLENKLPDFDRAFSALIDDIHERGLVDDTLVACFGEFGRTPKINKDAGRDHWAPAASLLFAGAGVRTGQVIGATDRLGAEVVDRPVRPADVACTIFDALGIDPRGELVTPDGRPLAILDEGERIEELYS